MTDDLEGRVVLVTGGARGQGATEARLLHAAGATVIVGDLLDDPGHSLVSELGERANYVHLDVTRPQDWECALDVAASLGGLYGLVNNAGVYRSATIAETDEALWRQHIDVNQYGCYLGLRAATSAMSEQGRGAIVNISSTAGLRGSLNAFAYCASKWAVRGMSRAAARELASSGVRVNCICPGVVDTEMLDKWTDDERVTRVAAVPMGRMGSVDEIAEVALFLISDRSSYMTGSEIVVDGGLSA